MHNKETNKTNKQPKKRETNNEQTTQPNTPHTNKQKHISFKPHKTTKHIHGQEQLNKHKNTAHNTATTQHIQTNKNISPPSIKYKEQIQRRQINKQTGTHNNTTCNAINRTQHTNKQEHIVCQATFLLKGSTYNQTDKQTTNKHTHHKPKHKILTNKTYIQAASAACKKKKSNTIKQTTHETNKHKTHTMYSNTQHTNKQNMSFQTASKQQATNKTTYTST